MNIREWDERYRSGSRQGDQNAGPALLVAQTVAGRVPGAALDLACGTGRNAVFLAGLGWRVEAVDGSAAALQILNSRHPAVQTHLADLERHEYAIQAGAWDLILSCYYLQRDLFPAMKMGVRIGGLIVAIAHTPEPGEQPNYKRANAGELRSFFEDGRWTILHYYEGSSHDPAHKRSVAEIVALREE